MTFGSICVSPDLRDVTTVVVVVVIAPAPATAGITKSLSPFSSSTTVYTKPHRVLICFFVAIHSYSCQWKRVDDDDELLLLLFFPSFSSAENGLLFLRDFTDAPPPRLPRKSGDGEAIERAREGGREASARGAGHKDTSV